MGIFVEQKIPYDHSGHDLRELGETIINPIANANDKDCAWNLHNVCKYLQFPIYMMHDDNFNDFLLLPHQFSKRNLKIFNFREQLNIKIVTLLPHFGANTKVNLIQITVSL